MGDAGWCRRAGNPVSPMLRRVLALCVTEASPKIQRFDAIFHIEHLTFLSCASIPNSAGHQL
jgi:hypothetical protein